MEADRVVLVTGATGNLGSAVVAACARQPVRLVLTARDQLRLDRLTAEIPNLGSERCLALAADAGAPDRIEPVVARALERFGHVDVLLNTVGGYLGGQPAWETTDETWEQLWRLNVLTCVNLSRLVLPGMMARKWGRIVNVGARAALEPRKNGSAYAAVKGAVMAFTLAIAAETKGSGVTANLVLPNTIDSPENRAALSKADPSKWATPAEVAATMLFLASDEAAAINGAAVPVYGQA